MRTRVLAPTGGHFALPRLVRVPVGEFADDYWGRAPLLSRADELLSGVTGFGDLFSNDAVDELVSRRGLRAPFLRVAKNGATLPDRDFTDGGGVGAAIADQASDDKLLRLFAGGSTIVLQGVHRVWEPVTRFAQDVAAELGHPVQVNAYVTPAQSAGFSDHYDVHDVFVLQVAGEKRWRIRPPVHPSPLRDEPWTDRRRAVEVAARREPLIEATLRPGDCLYLPRGYLHAATALGDVSTHLTIGVHPWTRRHLTDELTALAVTRASLDEQVRASMPFEVDLADPDTWLDDVEVVREAMVRALRDVSAAELAGAMVARRRRAQRPAPVSPVAQVRAAATLTYDDRLVLRGHLDAQLVSRKATEGPPECVLSSRVGDLTLGAADVEAVRALIEDGDAFVGSLGLDLARRLMVHGVATAPGDDAAHLGSPR